MTDHIPNDLSHLSNAEFNALCPQGEHAPGPEPLSPAAQAVWDAFNDAFERVGVFEDYGDALAAAFYAAADQVVPDEPYPENSQFWEDDEAIQEWHSKQYFRKRNLAIANELKSYD